MLTALSPRIVISEWSTLCSRIVGNQAKWIAGPVEIWISP